MERSSQDAGGLPLAEASPFAAFAMPKRSAVDEFQDRQRRAAETRRKMLGCVLACLVGAAGGATAWAASDGDLDTVLTALVGALAGASVGVPAGFILGGICFAVMVMTTSRGRPVVETEIARRDPMMALRGLLFAWSLIGVVIGAAMGSLVGANWAGAGVPQQSLARGTMIGSIGGGAIAIVVWFYTRQSARKTAESD